MSYTIFKCYNQRKCFGDVVRIPKRGRINQRLRRIDPTWLRLPQPEVGNTMNGVGEIRRRVFVRIVLKWPAEAVRVVRHVWRKRARQLSASDCWAKPPFIGVERRSNAWIAGVFQRLNKLVAVNARQSKTNVVASIGSGLSHLESVRNVPSRQLSEQRDVLNVERRTARPVARDGKKESQTGYVGNVDGQPQSIINWSVQIAASESASILRLLKTWCTMLMAISVLAAPRQIRFFLQSITFVIMAQRSVSLGLRRLHFIGISSRWGSRLLTRFYVSTVTVLRVFSVSAPIRFRKGCCL